ncbi:MAG: DNA repair protein RadA [Bacteroidales bacterium]|nr:DNA repair protein RadA [Bacteroidales bacterium]
MAKTKVKTAFFCSNCGAQSPKWVGRCPACGEWNTYTEEVIERESRSNGWNTPATASRKGSKESRLVRDIQTEEIQRIDTGNNELNRVLGGGLVPGSFVLVGGEPGIGKSTLMLQVALQIPHGKKVLYVSGEESAQQLRMRAERLGLTDSGCFILTETDMDEIFAQTQAVQPDILVADSIQTLTSSTIEASAGSISQIKECAALFQRFAKETGTSVFVIGHITKDGNIAGPKLLEHIVDTVLHFEGDRNYGYRILRSVKNRFGSTNEIGIYEMQNNGLREVSNPSEILLSQREENLSGTAVAATLEGLRPMIVEVQALVSQSAYNVAQRSATGFDIRRLNMLLAVLEKRCGAKLAQKDVFINIAGGLRVDDPAIDLAVIAAVLSSGQDTPLNPKDCFAAEVGLTGEIRPVSRLEQRLAEAEKLGFERVFVSKYGLKGIPPKYNSKIVAVGNLFELFQKIFSEK